MLTDAQRDVLAAARDAQQSAVATLTDAAIAQAAAAWEAALDWDSLTAEQTAALEPSRPRYPDLAYLQSALVDASAELRFATYLYNGVDDLAAAAAAELLTAHPTPVMGSRYTELGIVASFENPADGDACLRKLEAAATVDTLLARMLNWLKPGTPGLDFGVPSLRAAIVGLAAATVITDAEKNVLLSLGVVPATVNSADMRTLRL